MNKCVSRQAVHTVTFVLELCSASANDNIIHGNSVTQNVLTHYICILCPISMIHHNLILNCVNRM